MTQTPGIAVTGASGRMGQMLIREITASDKMHLAAAVERTGHDWVDRDVGEAMGGAARIVSTLEQYERIFGLAPSDSNAMLFCQGCVTEMGVDVYEAIRRMADTPAVAGGMVLAIGGLGLLVNIVVAWVLMRGEQTINVRGALLHVMGDLLGSVAALVAGAVIYLDGPPIADPILSLFVSLLILVSAIRLLREVTHVLMEGVPKGIDAHEVGCALVRVDGVCAIHDMHIWKYVDTQNIATVHFQYVSCENIHCSSDTIFKFSEICPFLSA